MKLIVGLGNPGTQYQKTRHNAGFMALDAFAKAQGASFKQHHKAQVDVAEVVMDGQKVLLAKPLTFMNKSGEAVRALTNFYKIEAKDVVVVHDELDLPFGRLRINVDASAGGHNGVASVIEQLGTKAFTRLRIGIGSTHRGQIPTDKFVLLPFSFFEHLKLRGVISSASEAVECLATNTAAICANKVN